MKMAIVLLTTLGILAAGSAALVVQSMKARSGPSAVEVLVMQMDAPATMCLTAEHVARQPVPARALPRGCLLDPSQAIGRYLVAPLMKGQVVTESNLVARGSLTEKLYGLAPGMTVATVAVQARSINDYLLYPGCYVDVLAALREGPASDAKYISGTLFRAMQVWSTGDESGGPTPTAQDKDKAASRRSVANGTVRVHLLASEEQTKILQMVGERGTITLTVRNPKEATQAGPQTELVADENLRRALGLMPEESVPPPPGPAAVEVSQPDAVPPPAKPPRVVTVIQGQKVTEQTFPPEEDGGEKSVMDEASNDKP